MCTAYDMVTPKMPDGFPNICFNPYLENDLGPTRPYTIGTKTYPAGTMTETPDRLYELSHQSRLSRL